jgi:DNA-binding transcriptional LysR family regulator
MELRQLRYFREILRHANFNRAADALGVTQPALSKSMRALEAELGVQLLERGATGVVATPYGRVLAGYADLVCVELDRATAEIAAMAGRGRGLVRVGGSGSVLRYLLPAAMRRLEEAEPGLEIRVVEGLRDDVVAALDRGDVDVGLCVQLAPDVAAAFSVVPLLRDEIVVVACRGHPLLDRPCVEVRDLARHRWILPTDREHERRVLAGFFEQAGVPGPDIAVQTASSAVMALLMEGRDHLSYIPRNLLAHDPAYAHLRAIPLELDLPRIDVCLVHRRAGVLLPSTRAFIREVRRVAEELETGTVEQRDGIRARPAG